MKKSQKKQERVKSPTAFENNKEVIEVHVEPKLDARPEWWARIKNRVRECVAKAKVKFRLPGVKVKVELGVKVNNAEGTNDGGGSQ